MEYNHRNSNKRGREVTPNVPLPPLKPKEVENTLPDTLSMFINPLPGSSQQQQQLVQEPFIQQQFIQEPFIQQQLAQQQLAQQQLAQQQFVQQQLFQQQFVQQHDNGSLMQLDFSLPDSGEQQQQQLVFPVMLPLPVEMEIKPEPKLLLEGTFMVSSLLLYS